MDYILEPVEPANDDVYSWVHPIICGQDPCAVDFG